MADSTFLWLALAVWLLGGLAGYYYLYRHGHPHPGWLLGSMVLGPFALLVFFDRVERSAHVVGDQPSASASGMKVLVGVDGSEESEQAVRVARRLMGDGACCLVLCEVVDYDTEDDPSGAGVAAARQRLTQVAETVPEANVTVEVVAGVPVQALAEVAEQQQADLVVVGTRGRGLSRAVLGSVAEGLVRTCRRPVLVAHRST